MTDNTDDTIIDEAVLYGHNLSDSPMDAEEDEGIDEITGGKKKRKQPIDADDYISELENDYDFDDDSGIDMDDDEF